MPSGNPELKALEGRLLALVQCVVSKARTDAEFAEQLTELLLSDTLRTTIRSRDDKKNRKEVFDPVDYLSQHNATALQQFLAAKPKSELVDIARKQRLAAPKAIKAMERDELIAKLVTYAQDRLKDVFFGHGKSERQPSESSQPQVEADSVTTDAAP